jgi:hypothetical protein
MLWTPDKGVTRLSTQWPPEATAGWLEKSEEEGEKPDAAG